MDFLDLSLYYKYSFGPAAWLCSFLVKILCSYDILSRNIFF